MSLPQDRQLLRLTALLQLERRAREAPDVAALGFLMVNDTHGIVAYRQAALWLAPGRIAALSGLAQPDRDAPFAAWLAGLLGRLAAGPGATEMRMLTEADAPSPQGWGDWLPARLIWLPLLHHGRFLGALALAREEPWTEGERRLLDILASGYGHALAGLQPRRAGRLPRPPLMAALLLGAVVGIGLLPVRDSVLAPAEVIAQDPMVVRAPLDGVVEQVHVRPNEAVGAGQLLLTLDPRRLQTQLEVARRASEVAEAELRQAMQGAVADPRARASIPMLQGRLEQQRAEVAFLQEQLARIEIRATQPGIAVFDDAHEWLGRPVVIGERIMQIADPLRTALEIRLPVADAIALEPGAEVRMFLNVNPEAPVPAELAFAAYRAQPGPDGVLAFRLRAHFPEGAAPLRIGLKGTAKLHGQEVRLAYHIFRRPLSAMRRWLGF